MQKTLATTCGTISTYSFVDGTRYYHVEHWRIRSDNDALAYALYLERRGRKDEAEAFLDVYLIKRS